MDPKEIDRLVAPVSRQLGAEGSFLRRYARWAVTQTDAPPAFHVLTGLAGIATVIPPHVETRLGIGKQKPNLFGMIVGESGRARKSWSMNLIQRLLEKAAPDRIGLRVGSYESAIAELSQKPYCTIFEPEFSRFLSQSNGNSGGYLQALKLGLTDLYDATPISRATMKVRHEIKDYRLSLIGAISDSYLSEYTEPADFTGGFLSRWLFVTGDRTTLMVRPDESPEAEAEGAALSAMLQRIYQHGPAGQYRFEARTHDLFDDWQRALDQMSAKADHRLVGMIERASALGKRVATMIAIDRIVNREGHEEDAAVAAGGIWATITREQQSDRTWEVTREDLETTIQIVHAHIEAAQRIVGRVEHTPTARNKAKVLHCLSTDTAVPLGHITLATGIRKREVQEYLETLTLEERARPIQINGNPWYLRVAPASIKVTAESGLPALPRVEARPDEVPPFPMPLAAPVAPTPQPPPAPAPAPPPPPALRPPVYADDDDW